MWVINDGYRASLMWLVKCVLASVLITLIGGCSVDSHGTQESRVASTIAVKSSLVSGAAARLKTEASALSQAKKRRAHLSRQQTERTRAAERRDLKIGNFILMSASSPAEVNACIERDRKSAERKSKARDISEGEIIKILRQCLAASPRSVRKGSVSAKNAARRRRKPN